MQHPYHVNRKMRGTNTKQNYEQEYKQKIISSDKFVSDKKYEKKSTKN